MPPAPCAWMTSVAGAANPLPMRLLLLALALAAASPVLAQDRSPAQRQVLIDLAYVLGETHALRQACAGQHDQFWRSRMLRLVAREQPEPSLDRRLKESFNTGYASRRSEFPGCAPAARQAEAEAAAKGRVLASRLARAASERPEIAEPRSSR